MRINKCLGRAIFSLALLLPLGAWAQESSVNTYSPYTLYGLGHMNYTGSTSFAAMGGASIGFRNGGFDLAGDLKLNVSNPASLSGLPPKSFIFEVGLTGSNIYAQQKSKELGKLKTSNNTFNISNITVGIPLARKLGMAINIAPYSQVGYYMHNDDEGYLADLGLVRYYYIGEGDITEAKASIGWEPFKGLSIGAELVYLWGDINRTYQAVILSYTGSGSYNNETGRMTAYTNEKVSRIYGAFGVQYTPLVKNKNRLTIGATYRLGGKLNAKQTDYIPSGNIYGDTVRFDRKTMPTYVPQTIGAGVYFHRPKYAIGVDYIYQNWADKNAYDAANNVGYTNTHTFKLGAQYTPDRYNIRSFMKRISYRVGFRYNDYYMQYQGQKINEKAVTFGFEIPFKMMTVSSVNLGVELGERGTLKKELIRERYFKINVGVFLFGRDYDYWFEKYKYN